MNENDGNTEKLEKAIVKERAEHKQTRDRLKSENEKLAAKLSEAERKIAEAAIVENPTAERLSAFIDETARAQLAAATNQQLGRIAALEAELTESRKQTEDARATLATRTVESALRDAIRQQHVLESAANDVLTLGKLELKPTDDDAVETADGLTAAEWLDARKGTSPYWWPTSRGSGARGSVHPSEIGMAGILHTDNDNPFDRKSSSFNLTAASRMMREEPQRAAKLQKAAAGQ